MTIYIALLRGINVGGHKIMKMSELKSVFEAMGFGRVQTYIQSGNVLFESEEDAGLLRQRIEEQLQTVFGFAVTVVLRTAAEMERVVADCPFGADPQTGGNLYVALLPDTPSQQGVDRLLAYKSEIDEYRMASREIYLLYSQGAAKTKLTTNFLEQRLGVPATARNWHTINKLVALGKGMVE